MKQADASLRTAPWEDYLFLLGTFWLVGGLGLDGFYHLTNPELESFWTPWHAVFYSGFTFSTAVLAWLVIRRRPVARSLWESVPPGYELAVVGLFVFGLGGIGDAIWHEIFGVESTLDALMSPTHIVLFVGSLWGITAPARAASRDVTNGELGLVEFLPAALSIGLATSVVAFFFQYGNGFDNWAMLNEFVSGQFDATAVLGVLRTMTSTVILVGTVCLVRKRWVGLPFGTFTIIFGIVGLLLVGLDGFEPLWQIIAPISGGLVADLVVRRWDRLDVLGICVPVAMWTVSTLAHHMFNESGVRWPPELWLGQIVVAGLVGWVLAFLASPPNLNPSAGAGQNEEAL